MKGNEARLVHFMEGSDKRFIIPVYQRNYDWKVENCKQLFDDIIKVEKQGRHSHFFGSIVSVSEGFNDHIIIDGQQRLTTVSLFMIALRNMIKEGKIQAKDSSIADKLLNKYLIDEYSKSDIKIKLKPIEDDRKAFTRLFDENEENIKDSNITANYEYFCNRIISENIIADDIYKALQKLEIINITLNHDDNPQLIFESLNSTGVALSEGDKIRNFILMGLPGKQQEVFYNKYWHKIEKATDFNVSGFIRDYLSLKQHATPKETNIYYVFKNFVIDNNLDTEALLKDLLSYAKRYKILIGKQTLSFGVDASIYRLNRLKTTVTRPFFLEVLTLYEEDLLTVKEVEEIFLIIENYIIRRNICEIPTNALNKIFIGLHREIRRYDATFDNYLEKLKYTLLSKKESARFPDDKEFMEALGSKKIYKMNPKNKTYVLERLENCGTKEAKAVYTCIDNGTYTIEHIMPQHLTNNWVKMLGDSYEEIHETWVHRLANLTLTAYNSEYSNRSFDEKKTMKNGFIDSGIKMNQYIARFDKWTLNELEQRNEHLINRCLEIWTYPETQYQPKEKQYDIVSLDDADDMTNQLILKFSFRGVEQSVSSWVDTFLKVLKVLYDEDSSVIRKFVYDDHNETGLSTYFSSNSDLLRTPAQLCNSIFVEKNTSTQTKIHILQKVFDEYSMDQSDLTFYLKEGKTTTSTQVKLHEIRKKYWEYALPIIQKKFKDAGPFGNVNPSKDNWIAGSFGIGDFYIGCVANLDMVRVEIGLSKPVEELNKLAFDYLMKNKVKIESKIGKELIWNRYNEGKASYIEIEKTDVSIINQEDWKEMAEFHATWVEIFYDIIVPYLREWNKKNRVGEKIE